MGTEPKNFYQQKAEIFLDECVLAGRDPLEVLKGAEVTAADRAIWDALSHVEKVKYIAAGMSTGLIGFRKGSA